jgi:DNA polymerase
MQPTLSDELKPLVARAAEALRGHLEFLKQMGVEGLPVASLGHLPVVTDCPTAVPATAAPLLTAQQRVGNRLPPSASKPAAPTPEPVRETRMPWERHLAGRVAPVPDERWSVSPKFAAAPDRNPEPLTHQANWGVAPKTNSVVRGAEGLRVIRNELGDCRRCKLWTGRTNLVFGTGNPEAELVFVGEGPGADEDLQGEPFVGKAGQLLTQMIRAMGYERGEVYICNVVKCRPPNNRDPEPDEVEQCSPFLRQQLCALGSKVIVTLGRHAAMVLLQSKVPISRMRGTWGSFEGVPVMPTFHPSYLLRDPTQKRYVWEDLKAVMQRLGRPIPVQKK